MPRSCATAFPLPGGMGQFSLASHHPPVTIGILDQRGRSPSRRGGRRIEGGREAKMLPLETVIGNFAARRMLVVGDLILDRFVYGSVSRISPEAPAPVIRAARVEEALGGAGNVARNIAALGADCDLVGVTGRDEAG